MILHGFKEGNDINRKIIKELINISIEKYEKSLDVIIYKLYFISFFLTKYGIFRGIDDFLRFLKSLRRKGIKCVFTINRSIPKADNPPNNTRDTLIEHLERVQFNNFLIRNREDILEVNLIEVKKIIK